MIVMPSNNTSVHLLDVIFPGQVGMLVCDPKSKTFAVCIGLQITASLELGKRRVSLWISMSNATIGIQEFLNGFLTLPSQWKINRGGWLFLTSRETEQQRLNSFQFGHLKLSGEVLDSQWQFKMV